MRIVYMFIHTIVLINLFYATSKYKKLCRIYNVRGHKNYSLGLKQAGKAVECGVIEVRNGTDIQLDAGSGKTLADIRSKELPRA